MSVPDLRREAVELASAADDARAVAADLDRHSAALTTPLLAPAARHHPEIWDSAVARHRRFELAETRARVARAADEAAAMAARLRRRAGDLDDLAAEYRRLAAVEEGAA